MKTNLYISNLDTPFSYHIAQHFRTDHLQVDPSVRILGSCPHTSQYRWLHASIDFKKCPQLACRAVLDCDIVILDLRSDSHQAETIIRFLKKVKEQLLKPIRIIGISSLLTWEGTKAFQLEPETDDKETMVANITDQNQWRPLELKDQDYQKRIPNVLANNCYQLENMLLGLKSQQIRPAVLGVGIVYGKENTSIQSEILRSLAGEELTIWGEGDNLLPLVHIDTVLQSIKLIVKSDREYAVIRDQQVFSQTQVKQLILKATSSNARLRRKQPLYVTEEESLWSFQQRIISSSIFNGLAQQRNFSSYCLTQMMADLCEYTEWTPNQFVLFTDYFQPDAVEAIKGEVGSKLEIISEAEVLRLSQQILMKSIVVEQLQAQRQKQGKKLSRQQLIQQQLESKQPLYAQALNFLLAQKKYLNFILVCSQKIKQFIPDGYFFNGAAFIVPNQDQTSQQRQIVYGSQEWCQLLDLRPKEESEETVGLQSEKKLQQPHSEDHGEKMRKDEKIVLTTQYLVDNVLGAIAEAKFNMRSKRRTTLRYFIDELKAIFDRGNYQSCYAQMGYDQL